MSRSTLLAGILLAALVSGCLGTSVPFVVMDVASQARLFLGSNSTTGTHPVFWSGVLEGKEARQNLGLETPPGFFQDFPSALEVSVKTPDTLVGASVQLKLDDGHGKREAKSAYRAQVLLLPSPKSGSYEVIVEREADEGDPIPFQVVAQIEPRPTTSSPGRDLLPDLVSLVATRLRIPGAGDAYHDRYYGQGCLESEYYEDGARRCLRLDGKIGNNGTGPLNVSLAAADGVLSGVLRNVLQPVMDGRWVQTITRSDGSTRQEDVGGAEFHLWHEHWHYEGLAHYQIFQYDVAKSERGAPVKEGTKAGFCFEDMGLLELGRLGTVPPVYDGTHCYVPFTKADRTWEMGVSPGWFDSYGWWLPGQYVEVSGVPDGDYQLVVRVNAAKTLIESDMTNNESSVVFRLTGNEVEILQTHGIVS